MAEPRAAQAAIAAVRAGALFYGGAWHAPLSGVFSPSLNPATGAVLAQVAQAGPEDVALAIEAAGAGFRTWRGTAPLERAAALRAFAAAIRRDGPVLALLDALDAGMPIAQVSRDIELAATAVEFFAGLVTEAKGETLPVGEGALNYTLRQPLGVVARIVAFNHPMMFAASRAAAPIAAGNALILKPSDQAPLSALRLADLAAGIFPPGVFNVLPGGPDCGAALAASPRVRKIGLIGSVPTGRAVLRAAAETIKPAALELGGKNALIACPDADPEAVAQAVVGGMNFAWGGQSCGSTSRVFLHEALHDRVLARVVALCRAITPGPPDDPATAMGSLISPAHRARVDAHVRRALDQGARLECGGGPPGDPALAAGAFYLPTVLSGVTPDMAIARDEVFGPVLAVLRWDDEDRLLQAVNESEFGLTASVWTGDLGRALRLSAAVEAGYVWVNAVSGHIHGAPFGGVKQSGQGREEGLDELLAYTEIKNVHIRAARQAGSGPGF